jgi:hypothetical protein
MLHWSSGLSSDLPEVHPGSYRRAPAVTTRRRQCSIGFQPVFRSNRWAVIPGAIDEARGLSE